MYETMVAADGVGIAAPQIGHIKTNGGCRCKMMANRTDKSCNYYRTWNTNRI